MDDPLTDPGPRPRGGLYSALAGTAISVTAMVTYFTVVPRWPDLRDSGVPNVLLALAGVAVGLVGLRRSFSARRGRIAGTSLFALSVLPAAFLSAYIFWLSYRLPGAEGVAPVGASAPAFRLKDQTGRERTLEEFKGRRVLLIFFRGHW